jgi:hypothetical protein
MHIRRGYRVGQSQKWQVGPGASGRGAGGGGGKRIAFQKYDEELDGQDSEIYTIGVGGRDPRKVTNNNRNDADPSWGVARDSSTLLGIAHARMAPLEPFEGLFEVGDDVLWVLDSDGEPHEVLPDPEPLAA